MYDLLVDVVALKAYTHAIIGLFLLREHQLYSIEVIEWQNLRHRIF